MEISRQSSLDKALVFYWLFYFLGEGGIGGNGSGKGIVWQGIVFRG